MFYGAGLPKGNVENGSGFIKVDRAVNHFKIYNHLFLLGLYPFRLFETPPLDLNQWEDGFVQGI